MAIPTDVIAGLLFVSIYAGVLLLAIIRTIERAKAKRISQKIMKRFSLFD